MVPKRFEHYLFNDNDYLPEHYEVADKEREELLKTISEKNNENTSDNANAGALITLENGANMTSGADMTLQNIRLNGQSYNGRAIHVKDDGALTILNNTQIERFKQTAAKDSTDNNDLRGGAILMDAGTPLAMWFSLCRGQCS